MLADVIRIAMTGYADRPALGQRAVEFVPDQSGRTVASLQPRFDTLTYRETWHRVRALANALAGDPVQPGDRVATLGFTSADYTIVDMALSLTGAVSVPLQTNAPVEQLRPSWSRRARGIAVELDHLETRWNSRSPARDQSAWWCSTITPRSTITAKRRFRRLAAHRATVDVTTLERNHRGGATR